MKLIKTIPALPVQDVETAVVFYRDRLGFAIAHRDDTFAIVTRDDVEIHLWAAHDQRWRQRISTMVSQPVRSGAESFLAGTSSCRIEVQGIDDLYEAYRASGVLYDVNTVVEPRPWGSREFAALDLERNLLTFYERMPGPHGSLRP
jgi:catechol 2,3-dioxygenase-like lactoylglutathione lyase family enzyme